MQDCEISSLNYPSVKSKSQIHESCQCDAVINSEVACQSVYFEHKSVQTESNTKLDLSAYSSINEENLASFLLNSMSMIEPIFDEIDCFNNTLQNSPEKFGSIADENCGIQFTKIFQSKSTSMLPPNYITKTGTNFTCVSVDVNCTGGMICAGFSSNPNSDWHESIGIVSIWSLHSLRSDKLAASKAVDHNCGITKVSFHPTQSSLVAAATQNGEVLCWNIAQHDQLSECIVGNSSSSSIYHHESVIGLNWITTPFSSDCVLVSISKDGQIYFWSIRNSFIMPISGFRHFNDVISSALIQNSKICLGTMNGKILTYPLSFSYCHPPRGVIWDDDILLFLNHIPSKSGQESILATLANTKSRLSIDRLWDMTSSIHLSCEEILCHSPISQLSSSSNSIMAWLRQTCQLIQVNNTSIIHLTDNYSNFSCYKHDKIITSSSSTSCHIINSKTGQVVHTIDTHSAISCIFSDDDDLLILGHVDGSMSGLRTTAV